MCSESESSLSEAMYLFECHLGKNEHVHLFTLSECVKDPFRPETPGSSLVPSLKKESSVSIARILSMLQDPFQAILVQS